QVELSENYSHKHQSCVVPGASGGLSRMCTEIAVSLFQALEEHGVQLEASLLRSLSACYKKLARSRLKPYRATAAINGLSFDQLREEKQIDLFALSLDQAWDTLTQCRLASSALPCWGNMQARLPDFGEQLRASARDDLPAPPPCGAVSTHPAVLHDVSDRVV
ncbi:MAG: hypothetical protein AAGM22_29750, partial [Acidobacteriota bacterium]